MSKINFGFEKIHQDEKENRVAGVFDSVAKNYDLMNDLMSFGMHRLWKEVLVEIAELNKDSYVLENFAFSLTNCLLVNLYKTRKLNSVNTNADQT